MEIVKGFPPNIAEIRAAFSLRHGTVFAYGETIYSPAGTNLPADLVEHERVHFAQQRAVGGPDEWWRRYIADTEFRLAQEVEAYRAQYAIVAALPRPERRRRLAEICKTLASSMYGSIVTKERARELIVADAPA